ncbi:hypothetical protein [Streptomyces boncukensis]|uniref:Uncharacterized protein n=1 Tax=Streptomyces boncukensis TaxID=2711219 RepID=A0A6G4WSI0_9ACTN|nr:hypothetical protein [Streptomyces boncukensis]NGO68226.1 hypothetical protein [Streptomyces boncukensis]
MPMIVDPSAPPVTPPERVTSPDGWLAALVDERWAGVVLSYNAASPPGGGEAAPRAADIRKVRIERQDPGTAVPVPVRSGDAAWAIEGVGTAYDHEAPLGVAVIYSATPVYADGSTGPASSLAVTVPAPEPGDDLDLWVKSLDEPGLSLRVVIVGWDSPSSAGRQDALDAAGSPYRVVAYDAHGAETVKVTVDVPPRDVDQVRELLRSGVLLAQVRPAYLTRDAFFVPDDITGPSPTGKLGSSGGYQFAFTIEPIDRPDTAAQPMRMPGWSYDTVAERFDSYESVAASYDSYASLSTDGIT